MEKYFVATHKHEKNKIYIFELLGTKKVVDEESGKLVAKYKELYCSDERCSVRTINIETKKEAINCNPDYDIIFVKELSTEHQLLVIGGDIKCE